MLTSWPPGLPRPPRFPHPPLLLRELVALLSGGMRKSLLRAAIASTVLLQVGANRRPCADESGSDTGLRCTVQGITWVMNRMKKAGTPPDTTSYNTCAAARLHVARTLARPAPLSRDAVQHCVRDASSRRQRISCPQCATG